MKLLPWTFFVLTIFVQSCCPKVAPVSETHQIDTVYKDRFVLYQMPAKDEVFETDFQAICDSLAKGKQTIITVPSKPKTAAKKNKSSLIINTQTGQIICHDSEYQDSLSVQDIIITDLHTIINENETKINSLNKSISFWKGMCMALGIVIIIIGGILYFKK